MISIATIAYMVHLPDDAILQCDHQAELLFRRPANSLLGKKLTDLDLYFVREDGNQITAEENPISRAALEKKDINGAILGMYCGVTKTLTWLKVDASPDFDEDYNVTKITASYTDVTEITERKIAESLSLKIKDEWEKTFDAMQDVVTILSPSLQVIRANKATYSLLEVENEKLAGRFCYEVFHNRTTPCENCPTNKDNPEALTKTGLVYNKRINKTFEISSSPVLNDDGSIKFLVHTARDVTQKIKDEAERAILSAATEQTSESVVITDTGGIIEYVNQSFTRTTGYSRGNVIGRNFKFLTSQDHGEEFFNTILATLKSGKVWKGRLTNRKKDGSVFEENATISPILNGKGEITNFVAVKRDVTKEELLQRQLQQAMKMEAIGTLAGGIAHDFNNILSAMIGYGQIAKSRLKKNDPLHEDIDQILTAGDRAANLVKQILTFSRKDTKEKFQPLNIQYIIKEVLKLLRSSLPTTIELEHHIDNSCGPILADPGQIHQVMMNLCTNAKQAIGGSYGRITINLKHFSIDEPLLLSDSSILQKGSYIDLMVEDNGSGMSDDIKKRIFDPFFTTKPKDQGTGLGLSVVHGIVKKHEGEITVTSRIGHGTTFHIYFPIVNEEVITKEQGERVFTGTERIMVVDDEEVIARVTGKMLSKMGYKPTLFFDSIKAVSFFRKNPNDIDAVITDMTMPNMTGAELSRELLSLRPNLPIIMTTGYSEIINREKAILLGIKEFLLKPVKKKDLSQMVRKVLDDGKNTRN